MMKKWVLLLLLIFLVFPLVSQAEEKTDPDEDHRGTLSGQVVNESGEPLTGGVVSFFDKANGVPMSGQTHRIPEMIGRMGVNGKFSTKLLPGTYYIGALIITDPGRGPGPPRPGEPFYFIRDDKGNLREFSVTTKETSELGEIQAAKPDTFLAAKDFVIVEGKLVREDGKPFAGGVVLAKSDMKSQRPDFVSERTGEDGHFLLKLPADKVFYLLGRERAVGRPVPGTYVGTYGSDSPISEGGAVPIGVVPPQSSPASGLSQFTGIDIGPGDELPTPVSGKVGETISGIDIKMFEMPVPGQQREKLQGTLGFGGQEKQIDAGEAKPAETAPVKEK